MAAPMNGCACHITDVENEPVLPFSDKSWSKLMECLEIWATLDGKEQVIAVTFDQAERETCGYHRRCYQKLTDKKRIECGLKRKEKGCLRQLQPDSEHETVSSPKKPLLRSQISSTLSKGRSQHVLPPECIICCKNKTVRDKSSLKRKIERLVSCETDAAGLLEAAKVKNDKRILLKIGDLDPVSIEVRYHSSCYKLYTKCLYQEPSITQPKPYEKSFDVFCKEVIEQRLIANEEILKISLLTELFVKTAKETEGVDISYRNCQLKRKLQARYDCLEFLQPKSNCCELVFYNKDGKSSLINMQSSDDDDSDYEVVEDSSFACTETSLQDDFAQLYRSALIIRAVISTCTGVDNWPPNADDMTLTSCEKIIPAELFNFLSWCCNISDDFSTEKLHLQKSENQKKIISLAQDIITLGTQGRTLMPKHLSLGMTIRHLTGSAKLQQLMNSFGHCVSHSLTLEHDTALAVRQLHRRTDIPSRFHPGKFTTLVWDNNDFGEETLTGKGTTHNTNGIIIQTADTENTVEAQEQLEPLGRNRKRTIDAPPVDITPYHGKKRTGPTQFLDQTVDTSLNKDAQTRGRLIDQAIFLVKYCQIEPELPGWSGCNQLLSTDSHPTSNIGYLPVIDASPTDKATVQAILEKSLQIAQALKLPSLVIVMDQAIYAKAQEIRWQGRDEFRNQIVIRLGEFHTAMAFLGALGKRFEHAGLKDIAVESGIVAEGSVAGVMNGHHFSRSIRCHKIMAEALHRLRLQDFMETQEGGQVETIKEILQMTSDGLPQLFPLALQNDILLQFLQDFQEYVDRKVKENAMYAFWSSYLEMVEQLLLFVRATREGNWELHLSTIREMIPWFFAYGRINYSRYLPVYYLEMSHLPESHPFVHANLTNGRFAVKRHNKHGFAMTACDQVIEQTFNRDSKTRGGLTGITMNKGAAKRWILSHPERAAIANTCYTMTSAYSEPVSSPKELSFSRIQADEQSVQDVLSTISHCTNPFTCDENQDIFNITTGKVASESIRTDLLSAYDKGESCFHQFVTERLTSNQKDLYSPLKLPSMKTFLHIDKLQKTKSLVTSLKEDRQMLSRLLIIAQEKGLKLKDVVKFPLSSVPPALANSDASMVKTMKSSLFHEVEKLASNGDGMILNDLSNDTVLILDAMAFIQQQRIIPETFGQFAISILQQVVTTSLKHKAKRVDFVGDRYPDTSIKQPEREKRSIHGETRVRIERPDQKMPKQVKKFMACGSNKEALMSFIVKTWESCPPDLFQGVEIYVTDGEACRRFYVFEGKVMSEDIPDLHTDHEEADTRMFLHAAHASKCCSNEHDIIIRTVDTDVFILSLWAAKEVENRIILNLSIANNSRLLDMKKMSTELGNRTVTALLGLHPFTGCDSTSAFRGKGKLKALKIMLKDSMYLRVFEELGQEWHVSDVVAQDLELFVCELYGWQDSVSVNDVRYDCFRFGYVSEISMPPNRDSLRLHIMRANYQARIYRCSMKQYISPPSPEDHGWIVSQSKLAVRWRNMDIAPASVMQSVSCKCKKSSCDSARCSCKHADIACTEMCQCGDCHNRKVDSDTDTEEEEC